MNVLREYIQSKPHHVLSVPALLCFIQFVTNLVDVFRTGVFDGRVMNQLLSSADGFETVVLCIIMLALKHKKSNIV